ncbi:MAG: hypothetical protein ACN4GM_16590 [Gammaproteobacteria bacterium]
MDKINSLNNIVEIFRSKASSKKTKTKKKELLQKSTKNKLTVKKLSPEELENSIKLKINQLDSSAKNFKSKANNIFIENILSWEFGTDLQDDPEFIALREKINIAIDENQSLNNDLNKLIDKMLAK